MNLTEIIAAARQILRDEFKEGIDQDWKPDELKIHAGYINRRISEVTPLETIESVSTTADDPDIDISDITGLIKVVKVESPTGSNPKSFVPFTVFGTTVTLSHGLAADGDNVNVYCHELHTVNESGSTYNFVQERLMIDGIAAKAALSLGRSQLNELNKGGANTGSRMIDWGNQQLAIFENQLRSQDREVVFFDAI